MEVNKPPGSDGFLVVFYQVFWNVTASPFVNAVNCSFFRKGSYPQLRDKAYFLFYHRKTKFLFSKKLEANSPSELMR